MKKPTKTDLHTMVLAYAFACDMLAFHLKYAEFTPRPHSRIRQWRRLVRYGDAKIAGLLSELI